MASQCPSAWYAPAVQHCEDRREARLKLGIGSYTYMWSIGVEGATPAEPMTALALLRKAQEFGVHVVQYGPNLSLGALPPEDLQRLIEEATDANIELEVGMAGIDPGEVKQQTDLAHSVGATLLRTVPAYARSEPIHPDQFASQLAPLVPYLSAAGVRLAIENAAIPSQVLRDALDQLATPWIGITLDTVNSLTVPEGTKEVARTLAPHTMCVHVKDFAVQRIWHMMGFTVEGRPAGRGQLDIPRLLVLLREAGVSPNVILELWPPAQTSLEDTIALEQTWAAESVEYLRQFIPE